MTYEEAVKEIFFWQRGTGSSFYVSLIELFQRADDRNKANLALGFPAMYDALKNWNTAGDCGNDLFREHGLLK